MNTEQAKKIPLDRILSKFGFLPDEVKHKGNELWYKSPLREEKTPSFKLDIRKNLWHDFGSGEGGTVVDLVMKLKQTDVKGALEILKNDFNYIKPKDYLTKDLFETKPNEKSAETFVLKEVKKFPSSHSGTALAKYITQDRGIDAHLATQFLKEIHFKNIQTGKHYFAVGIENTEGGYEIRNPFFKSTVPETTKSISLIKGQESNENILCFEGFLDFLSYGTLFGIRTTEDYLILNSVSHVKNALEAIKNKGYKNIKTFFDNDLAGQNATEQFKIELSNVEPQNAIYAQNEDLNAFLVQQKQEIVQK